MEYGNDAVTTQPGFRRNIEKFLIRSFMDNFG